MVPSSHVIVEMLNVPLFVVKFKFVKPIGKLIEIFTLDALTYPWFITITVNVMLSPSFIGFLFGIIITSRSSDPINSVWLSIVAFIIHEPMFAG